MTLCEKVEIATPCPVLLVPIFVLFMYEDMNDIVWKCWNSHTLSSVVGSNFFFYECSPFRNFIRINPVDIQGASVDRAILWNCFFWFGNTGADAAIAILLPNLTFKNLASYVYRTGLLLPSRCCILYIYIFPTNISTEYFKHVAHSPFFFSKCRLFHNATIFGSCIIHILHTGCAKI